MTMGTKTVIDCETGKTTEVEQTPTEIAQAAADRAAAQAAATAQAALDTTEATARADADQALDGLRLIANSTGTLTGAQLSNAVRLLAKVAIRLVRLQLRKLDGAD